MVRRELTALLGDGVAAPAGSEDHRRGVDHVLARARAPAVLGLGELSERTLRERGHTAGLNRVAKCSRDRMACAVADLKQALRRRAAAACAPVAALLPGALDA